MLSAQDGLAHGGLVRAYPVPLVYRGTGEVRAGIRRRGQRSTRRLLRSPTRPLTYPARPAYSPIAETRRGSRASPPRARAEPQRQVPGYQIDQRQGRQRTTHYNINRIRLGAYGDDLRPRHDHCSDEHHREANPEGPVHGTLCLCRKTSGLQLCCAVTAKIFDHGIGHKRQEEQGNRIRDSARASSP